MAFPAMSGSGFDTGPTDTPLLGTLANWVSAALSVALVAGLIWWAYDIVTRDTRAVPVIQAMEGPARVTPDDPGGFQAPHAGYAVNAIAGEEPREPVAETVTLAPEPAPVEVSDAPVQRPGTGPAEDAIRNSIDRALMDALGVEPAAPPPSAVTADGVRRPAPRPENAADVTRAATTEPQPLIAASIAPASAAPLGADAIAPGTRLVQLGAFPTEADAQAEWAELATRFAEYFGEKRPVYEQAETGGQTVWRLRAHGFEDRADARRFCEVLLVAQAECIPVLTR